MKKTILSIAIIGLSSGMLFTGCNNPPEKKIEQSQEDMHEAERKAEQDKLEAQNKYEEDWLKFKNETEERLKSNEAELARYRENSGKMKKTDRADYDAKLVRLEEQNKDLRRRMDEYNNEPDKEKRRDRWEEFKREFNHDMDELGNAFRDLGENNKK
jgi:uncharacterized membrane protein YgaE (UPF0421/DUF939 family)